MPLKTISTIEEVEEVSDADIFISGVVIFEFRLLILRRRYTPWRIYVGLHVQCIQSVVYK